MPPPLSSLGQIVGVVVYIYIYIVFIYLYLFSYQKKKKILEFFFFEPHFSSDEKEDYQLVEVVTVREYTFRPTLSLHFFFYQ